MLTQVFPKQFGNVYRGQWLALWLLVPIVLSKLAMGANSIINTRLVATSADGIPLDSYNAAGADAVVSMFALWGLCTVLIALLGVLALIRYRAMIPLIYLLLLIEQLGRKALLLAHPIAKSSAQPFGFYVNLTLLVMLLVGLGLSLLNRSASPAPRAVES